MKLSFEHISKLYGNTAALQQIDLTLGPGVYGLLGPNGAGKTTLMRIMTDLLAPSTGRVLLDGQDIAVMGAAFRKKLGYLPQDFGVYPNFTAEQFLLYIARLKGLSKFEAKRQTDGLLHMVGLEDKKQKKLKGFSGGQRQRVGIAQALLNEPKVLILDEPTSGLDPGERMRFRNLLSEFGRNRIVLISTHIVSDVEYIATCNAVMKNGKIAAVGETEELVKEVEGKVWNVVLDMAEVMTYETKIPVVNIYNREDGKTVLRYLAERPVIPGSEPADARMEDLYLWMFPEQGREEVR